MHIRFTIINLLAAAVFLLLVGCASTAQRVGDNKYRVDCSGMFSRTSDCYNVATTTCEGGKFTEINMAIRDQGDVYDAFCDCYVWVISRNLTFKCG